MEIDLGLDLERRLHEAAGRRRITVEKLIRSALLRELRHEANPRSGSYQTDQMTITADLQSAKICRRCRVEKPLLKFDRNRNNKTDGRSPYCKECERKRHANGRKLGKGSLYELKRRLPRGTPLLTLPEWIQIQTDHGHRCATCGAQRKLEIDHIIPVSRGGTSTAENIQPLCRSCNASKRDNTQPVVL